MKKFLHDLRSRLEERYGDRENYTAQEIDTIFEENYSAKEKAHAWYAYAMYTDKRHFDRVCQERGENHEFDALRTEIIGVLLKPAVKPGTSGHITVAAIDTHSDGGER